MKKLAREIIAKRLDTLMGQNEALSTQDKLGARTMIAPSTIGRIRRAEVSATADNLQSIAAAFKVPVGYLFGDDESQADKAQDGAKSDDVVKLVTVYCRVGDTGRELIMAAVDEALEQEALSFSPWDQLKQGNG